VKYLFQDEFNGNKLHISPKIEINNEQLITSLLKDIMLKLTKRYYNPETFIDSFIKVHSKTYTRYIQQDTVEFCRTLLEDISKETNKVKNKTQYQELDTKNKSKIELNKEYDLLFRKREDSFVIDTFYIQLSSTFKCDKCGFDSYSFQKILDLPLLIPLEINNPSKPNVSSSYINSSSQSRMVQREISVIDLCKNYFKEESYDWSDKCEGCNSQTKHIKKVQIASLPPVLILSIQRYNYNLTFPYKASFRQSRKTD
jgi:ubiquitin C-terminal hydrolase